MRAMTSVSSLSAARAASGLQLLQDVAKAPDQGAAGTAKDGSATTVKTTTSTKVSGDTMFAILNAAAADKASAAAGASTPTGPNNGTPSWMADDPYLQESYTMDQAIDQIYESSQLTLDEGTTWGMSGDDLASFKTAVANRTLKITSLDDVAGANASDTRTVQLDSSGAQVGGGESFTYNSDAVNKATNGSTRVLVSPNSGYAAVSGFLIQW